jgi:hypothetical protein
MRSVDLFRGLDLDRSGRVTRAEFIAGLKRIGMGAWAAEEVEELMGVFDADGDGEISIKELKEGLRKHEEEMKEEGKYEGKEEMKKEEMKKKGKYGEEKMQGGGCEEEEQRGGEQRQGLEQGQARGQARGQGQVYPPAKLPSRLQALYTQYHQERDEPSSPLVQVPTGNKGQNGQIRTDAQAPLPTPAQVRLYRRYQQEREQEQQEEQQLQQQQEGEGQAGVGRKTRRALDLGEVGAVDDVEEGMGAVVEGTAVEERDSSEDHGVVREGGADEGGADPDDMLAEIEALEALEALEDAADSAAAVNEARERKHEEAEEAREKHEKQMLESKHEEVEEARAKLKKMEDARAIDRALCAQSAIGRDEAKHEKVLEAREAKASAIAARRSRSRGAAGEPGAGVARAEGRGAGAPRTAGAAGAAGVSTAITSLVATDTHHTVSQHTVSHHTVDPPSPILAPPPVKTAATTHARQMSGAGTGRSLTGSPSDSCIYMGSASDSASRARKALTLSHGFSPEDTIEIFGGVGSSDSESDTDASPAAAASSYAADAATPTAAGFRTGAKMVVSLWSRRLLTRKQRGFAAWRLFTVMDRASDKAHAVEKELATALQGWQTALSVSGSGTMEPAVSTEPTPPAVAPVAPAVAPSPALAPAVVAPVAPPVAPPAPAPAAAQSGRKPLIMSPSDASTNQTQQRQQRQQLGLGLGVDGQAIRGGSDSDSSGDLDAFAAELGFGEELGGDDGDDDDDYSSASDGEAAAAVMAAAAVAAVAFTATETVPRNQENISGEAVAALPQQPAALPQQVDMPMQQPAVPARRGSKLQQFLNGQEERNEEAQDDSYEDDFDADETVGGAVGEDSSSKLRNFLDQHPPEIRLGKGQEGQEDPMLSLSCESHDDSLLSPMSLLVSKHQQHSDVIEKAESKFTAWLEQEKLEVSMNQSMNQSIEALERETGEAEKRGGKASEEEEEDYEDDDFDEEEEEDEAVVAVDAAVAAGTACASDAVMRRYEVALSAPAPSAIETQEQSQARAGAEARVQAEAWVAAVTGVAMPQPISPGGAGAGVETAFAEGDAAFGAWLKDGVLLCNLVNVLRPGSIKRISESSAPFKQMENVKAFLCTCRDSLGVADHDCFETVDLVKDPLDDGGKGARQVVRCLHSLGRMVQRNMPEFSPQLCPSHKQKKHAPNGAGVGFGNSSNSTDGGRGGINMAKLKSQHGLF